MTEGERRWQWTRLSIVLVGALACGFGGALVMASPVAGLLAGIAAAVVLHLLIHAFVEDLDD
jgi:hypothetical protein